jgi:hypothetical protein
MRRRSILGLVTFLALAVPPVLAQSNHNLGSPVDETGDVALCNNPEPVLMVTIPTTRSGGGTDADSTTVSVGGSVLPTDVAAIRVFYDVLEVGSVTGPGSLTDVTISLPGNQKGGNDWTFYVDLNPSAAGKTLDLTVTTILGTDDANLPHTTTPPRNALSCASTTTLGDGTDPTAAPTICPGDPATVMDAFSFVTDGNSDDVDDGRTARGLGPAAEQGRDHQRGWGHGLRRGRQPGDGHVGHRSDAEHPDRDDDPDRLPRAHHIEDQHGAAGASGRHLHRRGDDHRLHAGDEPHGR